MPERSDPFGDIERLFNEMSSQFGMTTGRVAVDLVDEGDAYRLRADLPGYDVDGIDVQLTDGRRVHLEATRATESASEGETYVTRERHQEQVSRTVTLPEAVDEEGTEAAYDDGVLEVRLPKRTVEDEGTDIPVN